MKKKPKEQKSYDFGNQPKFYSLDGDLDLADEDTLPRKTAGEYLKRYICIFSFYVLFFFLMKKHVKCT